MIRRREWFEKQIKFSCTLETEWRRDGSKETSETQTQ